MALWRPKTISCGPIGSRSQPGKPPKNTASFGFGGGGQAASVPCTIFLPVAAISSGVTRKVAMSSPGFLPQAISRSWGIECDIPDLRASHPVLSAVLDEPLEHMPGGDGERPPPAIEHSPIEFLHCRGFSVLVCTENLSPTIVVMKSAKDGA